MARWEPNARERLAEAAMELFAERGYDRTTVGDIASRAGLTERTFFRYFTDKREVLFTGSEDLEKTLVQVIAGAPSDMGPLATVSAAFEAAAAMLQEMRDLKFVRLRYGLVMKHAEIQERELIKMSSLARSVTKALHTRGVVEPAASLAAEAGVAVFKIAFERWVGQKKPQDFAELVRESMATLRAVAAEAKAAPKRASQKAARRA